MLLVYHSSHLISTVPTCLAISLDLPPIDCLLDLDTLLPNLLLLLFRTGGRLILKSVIKLSFYSITQPVSCDPQMQSSYTRGSTRSHIRYDLTRYGLRQGLTELVPMPSQAKHSSLAIAYNHSSHFLRFCS